MNICCVDYCPRPVHAKSLCVGHYWQKHRGKDLTPLRDRRPQGMAVVEVVRRELRRSRVMESGCWRSAAGKGSHGYPHITLGKTQRPLPALVLEVSKGPRPEGMMCRHLCGESSCINPDHLEWGTWATNSWDVLRHGRHRQRKLSDRDVRRIRSQMDWSRGRLKALASELNVHRDTVARARDGKTFQEMMA